jgi:hypothetical protein
LNVNELERLKDDYELVSGGLVRAIDALDQVYGLLRLGDAGAALAVVADARQAFGWRVQG